MAKVIAHIEAGRGQKAERYVPLAGKNFPQLKVFAKPFSKGLQGVGQSPA